jgi:hypothetical protein
MEMNEFYVNNSGSPALGFRSITNDICGMDADYDERDELLDKLSDMKLSKFKSTYPKIYRKYYKKKLIDAPRIVINYHYPLVTPIDKIYTSENGFSINDIATIIQTQYEKFFDNYDYCIANNQIPKYLDQDFSSSKKYYGIRFHINYKPLKLKTSSYYHSVLPDIPFIMVAVDT